MPTRSQQRWHALDAVRGFALLLGVAYHAALSFLPGPTFWLVSDADRSRALGAAFFTSHMFRMTLFFLVAGFFARLAVHKRGVKGFVADRAKRIALPLVVGWLLLFPAIVAVSVWAERSATAHRAPAAAPSAANFPLTHLWFLYVLLWLYAGALVMRAAVLGLDASGQLRAAIDRAARRVASSLWGPAVLSIPFLVATARAPVWHSWFGIPTPDRGLLVNPQALAAFGTAFAVGWLVHRNPCVLCAWQARWAAHLACAVALTCFCLWLVGPTPVITPAIPGLQTRAYAVCYGAATWSWTFAIVGAAQRFRSDFSAGWRYVADASYWIYLIHLPLVMALQVLVARLPWTWFAKYPLLLGGALLVMFASYEGLVRDSFVGAVLSGRRQRRRESRLAYNLEGPRR